MALRAVQKNKDDSGTLSYTKSAAVGALIGYSLKHILPVTPQEKDEKFNASLNAIRVKAKEAELAEVKKIRNLRRQSEAADTFIRMYDAKTLNPTDFDKIKKTLVNDVRHFFTRINEEAQEISEIEIKNLKKSVKKLRPTSVFVVMGFVTGLLIALVNNVLTRITRENPQYTDY